MSTKQNPQPQQPDAQPGKDSLPAILNIATDHYTQLLSLAQRAHELQEKLLRLAAEMDNLKKRTAREKDEARRFANENFAQDIVSALDNFHLGIQAATTTNDPSAIASGIHMALLQLTNVLQNHGLTPIDAEGAPFDPNLHEAIGREPAPAGTPDNTIIRQVRRGWKYHDRLLRPASVIVAVAHEQHPAEAQAETAPTN